MKLSLIKHIPMISFMFIAATVFHSFLFQYNFVQEEQFVRLIIYNGVTYLLIMSIAIIERVMEVKVDETNEIQTC
jgi:4-hydroxybenzoate polyprenyltransferase